MESFLTIRALQEQLGRMGSDDPTRLATVKNLFAACEQLVNYSESNHMLSANEEFEELTPEQLVCLLGNFLVAKAYSDYETAREQRYEAVEQAIEHLNIFTDRMLMFGLYSDEQIRMLAGELNPAEERDVRRANMIEEEKCRKHTRLLFDKLLHEDGADVLETLRSQVHQAKFEALREHKFLAEEFELLEFERSEPQEAKAAVEARELMPRGGKPEIVQMDEQAVNAVQKHGKFVPLDMVELIKLHERKAAENGENVQDGELTKVIETNMQKTSEPINWNELDLQAGGGNPYTDTFGGREYRVVRTDRYELGEGEPEKEYGWENDAEARPRDEEEQEDEKKWRDELKWDDWKDEHPAGQGNKRRMVE